MEGRPRPLVVPAIEFGDPRPVAHRLARRARADDPARAAGPVGLRSPSMARSRSCSPTSSTRHPARPPRRPGLARGHPPPQPAHRGGDGRPRRHRRRDAGRRVDAGLLERPPGGRVRAGDPARDRASVRRPRTADPRADRHPHGRRDQEAEQYFGSTVHFAARVAGQAIGGEVLVSSAVYELVRLTPASRSSRVARWSSRGSRGPTPALRRRPFLDAARQLADAKCALRRELFAREREVPQLGQ